ncbi:hypothetical protein E2C01_057544 [Portunus trituberculatus]|uniref:Uncharacterized protein n=1 Tax=Portunus trituberculatus TaxID=210409 RepID=A0A5B7H1D3_PORTR|nr:hypothetical protein [Portunus trituberculatus]
MCVLAYGATLNMGSIPATVTAGPPACTATPTSPPPATPHPPRQHRRVAGVLRNLASPSPASPCLASPRVAATHFRGAIGPLLLVLPSCVFIDADRAGRRHFPGSACATLAHQPGVHDLTQ